MRNRLGELFERLVDKAFPYNTNDLEERIVKEGVIPVEKLYGPELKIFVDPRADPEIHFPKYKTDGAAGFDLAAYVPVPSIILEPGERRTVFTGISMVVPYGYEVQIRPRSGWAVERGITVLNTPGTIDSDYRGKVHVLLYNASSVPCEIKNGDRIAQGVLAPVERAALTPIASIDMKETARGKSGFGSTGR